MATIKETYRTVPSIDALLKHAIAHKAKMNSTMTFLIY